MTARLPKEHFVKTICTVSPRLPKEHFIKTMYTVSPRPPCVSAALSATVHNTSQTADCYYERKGQRHHRPVSAPPLSLSRLRLVRPLHHRHHADRVPADQEGVRKRPIDRFSSPRVCRSQNERPLKRNVWNGPTGVCWRPSS